MRHVLADFCLLDRWEDFDNSEALLGYLPDDEISPNDWEEIEKFAR